MGSMMVPRDACLRCVESTHQNQDQSNCRLATDNAGVMAMGKQSCHSHVKMEPSAKKLEE